MKNDNRGVIRLRVDQGLVLLSHENLPVFACALLDLSETGCRCEAAFDSVDPTAASEWKVLLKPGLHLTLEVTRPPDLGSLRIKTEAEVARVDPYNSTNVELGIHFLQSEDNVVRLQRGLLEIAKGKLDSSIYPAVESGEKLEAVSEENEKKEGKEEPAPPVQTVQTVQTVPPTEATKKTPSALASHDDEVRDASQEICDILVGQGRLKPEHVHAARVAANATNTSVTRMLMNHRSAKPVEICHALSAQSGLPVTQLEECSIPANLGKIFSFLTLQRYEFVPISETKEQVFIAAAHPLPLQVLNELERTVQRPIVVFLAPLDQIQNLQFRLRPRGSQQERRHPRAKTQVHAVYQYCNEQGVNLDDQEREGTVSNMSDGGFLVMGQVETKYSPIELIKQGTLVRIEFSFDAQPIHALCKLKHVEAVRQTQLQGSPLFWAMGLEIVRIDKGEAQMLKDFCTRAAIEQMKTRSRGFNTGE